MSKGLEALEKIKKVKTIIPYKYVQDEYSNEINSIEKELKAFEIIKKSICDIRVNYWEDLDRYTMLLNHCSRDITKEEYDLLKEVLL